MRKLCLSLIALVLAVSLLSPAAAGPTAGGLASGNVSYVGFVPFEAGVAIGARTVGKYLYVTGAKSISIYDISKPAAPELVSFTPVGVQWENEDVSTNGKVLLFSESLGNNSRSLQGVLHVWDVRDKKAPKEIGTVPNAGDHTATCILDCKWAYGSDGAIVDLRNPSKPKLAGDWHDILKVGVTHDVEEFKPGFLIASVQYTPFLMLDVRNPLRPKVLAQGAHPNSGRGFLFHSGRWPRGGKDRFVLMQGEDNANPRCSETNGPFMVFDASKWRRTKTFNLLDTFRVDNGTYLDGRPPVNGLGCSAHWFSEHPDFRNGGLVAIGYYEHGTRFLEVSPRGKVKEVGWFLPYGGSTSAAHWVTDEIVYAIDYTRGFDILQFEGRKS